MMADLMKKEVQTTPHHRLHQTKKLVVDLAHLRVHHPFFQKRMSLKVLSSQSKRRMKRMEPMVFLRHQKQVWNQMKMVTTTQV